MKKTPQGMRLHIGIFGRRNVGKSSLLNAITGHKASIVSQEPGCTTDPVRKAMELHPIGPVLFTDTAGLDDNSTLGNERIRRSKQILSSTDVALVVALASAWGDLEDRVVEQLLEQESKVIAVFNKCDEAKPNHELKERLSKKGCRVVETSVLNGEGIFDLKRAIVDVAPGATLTPSIAADLLPTGGLAVLVIPIDLEAPKGRLILPQVQVIRDLLDGDQACLVVKERELKAMLSRLKEPPDLVITDSQAFLKVAADIPPDVPLTSFSILFARLKGDLARLSEGARAIEKLKPGDKVLIAEACTHHPVGEDIGRVKIPRWLTNYVGGKLQIDNVQGKHFPEDLSQYSLVIHCGGCMFNRRAVLSRISACSDKDVPITNYGLTIAYVQGLFKRALSPFH